MKSPSDLIKNYWVDLLFVAVSVALARYPEVPRFLSFINGFLISFLVWFSLVRYSFESTPVFSLHNSYKYLAYTSTIAGTLIIRLVSRELGGHVAPFFLPIALISMLISKEFALRIAVFLSVLYAYSTGFSMVDFGFALASSVVTAISTHDVSRRLDLARSAIFVSIISGIFFVFQSLLIGKPLNVIILGSTLIAPLIWSIVTVGILPYVEYASMIYSNIDLMELGNLNNPLLKNLSLKAPGTYYHSTIVANLAEAAAQKIGANAVLTRVASYFHDIGKAKRPYFYTENIGDDDLNPHDEIAPKLSHLIIQDHVKTGLEMAKKHRLPLLIQDVIPQHHGTRVQKYFYHKSKGAGEKLSESEFQYSGPKPQFKEAGIIMLADSVEAAVRSLKKPTPSRLKNLVQEIVFSIYNEGELDESGLTLRDLEIIIEEFTKVLVSMMKSRIEYPKEEIKGVIKYAQNSSDKQN